MSTVPSLHDIKKGLNINWNNEPYTVMESNFVRMQQRKPVMQTKLKNLLTGKIIEYSFKPGDKIEVADLQQNKANYLYKDENFAYFMDNLNYEQFSIPLEKIAAKIKFLKENTDCDILYYESKPITIDLPIKMNFKVTTSPPGVKGDSSSNVTKQITIETGAVINAPLFIKEGEEIVVNTETSEYVGRA